jgi:hypothetical protein
VISPELLPAITLVFMAVASYQILKPLFGGETEASKEPLAFLSEKERQDLLTVKAPFQRMYEQKLQRKKEQK